MSRTAARALLTALGLCSPAAAVTIQVPTDYPTIQAALFADIADLEEIVVLPGTYAEAIDFNGRAVTLRASGGPDLTTIDATGLGDTAVRFESGEGPDSVLDGFTVRGGTGDAAIFVQSIGGGTVCLGGSNPTIRNCTFADNVADFGGAAFIQNSSPTIESCVFADNTAGIGLANFGDGGALYLSSASSPMIDNCVFVGNAATTTTGSLGNGGALSIEAAAMPTVVNCTFHDNTAEGAGGAIRAAGNGATFVNCIVWSNTPDQVSGAPAVTFSDVEGGYGGAGNLDADPAFIDATGRNFRLTISSPCIGAGDNGAAAGTTEDLDGLARFVGDVDMGAFEFPGARVHNVTQDLLYGYIQPAIDAAQSGDEIVADPGTYREAIDLLGKAMTVRSQAGKDVTTIDATGFGDTAVRADSGEGPATVVEGFLITGGTGDPAGGPDGGGMYIENAGPTVTDCDFYGNSARNGAGMYCILNSDPLISGCKFVGNVTTGLGYGGAIYFGADSPAAVIDCLFLDNDADDRAGACYLQGASNVTFTDCIFNGNHADDGGAVYVSTSRPVFTGCSFITNFALIDGGAVYISDFISNPTFSSFIDCVFDHNLGAGRGGAIFSDGSAHSITGCTFTNHFCPDGGALYNLDSHPEILECVFTDNYATVGPGGGGGAIFNDESRPVIERCTFGGNFSDLNGGAILNSDTGEGPDIVNCVFHGGFAFVNGGAVFNEGASSPTIVHGTFVYNNAPLGAAISSGSLASPTVHNSVLWNESLSIYDPSNVTTVTYSDLYGGWSGAGTGNIEAQPGFVDIAGGDFRLAAGSPCIDAADNTAVPAGVTTDRNGKPRFIDDPDTVDTGVPDGLNPISDMGAFEYDPCPTDFDGDGDTGINDFLELLAAWGPNPGHPADLDADGVVGINDFLALLAAWGPCP